MCEYFFSKLRDKIPFVINLRSDRSCKGIQNPEVLSSGIQILGFEIRDTAQGIWNPTKGYFLKLIAHSQVFSTLQMAAESHFPPWGRCECQNPYRRALHKIKFLWVALPHILGRTIDKCITLFSSVMRRLIEDVNTPQRNSPT